jgi:hypothetical protein
MAERIVIFRFHTFAARSKCQALMQNSRTLRILEGALRLWGVAGTVTSDPDTILITPAAGKPVAVQHGGAAGWTVTLRDPTTGAQTLIAEHAGLPGLLRSVRAELAPDAPRGRLLIAPG